MKTFAFIFCTVFFLSCSLETKSQVLGDGYYIGKEKYNLLQTYYYLLTIDCKIASIEIYMVSKGQTSSHNFFQKGDKLPDVEKYTIIENGLNYKLENNSGQYLNINTQNELILFGDEHKVNLKQVDLLPKNYISMKNESLYTFAYYHPHQFMGLEKKFESKKETTICFELRKSNILEESERLNYSEFYKLLYEELEKIIRKY